MIYNLKLDSLDYIYIAESMVYLQPLLRNGPRKLTKFSEITQNNGHYAVL